MSVINIIGAGGIGKAAAQIALNVLDPDIKVCVGDISTRALSDLEEFVIAPNKESRLTTYVMSDDESTYSKYFDESDVVLDCLPGSFAPKVARMAKKHKAHYANLTEYVQETNEIKELAIGAETGFILQTGLAPGYINILAHGLFRDFCAKYNVTNVDQISMKVGALTKNAVSPHFYGFTWSPIGVATEYVKDAVVLRDHEVVSIPALSGIESLMIDGDWYEDNFTSGGAADLPEAFKDRVRNMDYKTLRYPGHYQWVKDVLNMAPYKEDRIQYMQDQMLKNIPHYAEDVVIIYADVKGMDDRGNFMALDQDLRIEAIEIGGRTLTAIQATTAAPLIECAHLLMTKGWSGPILQSTIDPHEFMDGPVVSKVYGKYNKK